MIKFPYSTCEPSKRGIVQIESAHDTMSYLRYEKDNFHYTQIKSQAHIFDSANDANAAWQEFITNKGQFLYQSHMRYNVYWIPEASERYSVSISFCDPLRDRVFDDVVICRTTVYVQANEHGIQFTPYPFLRSYHSHIEADTLTEWVKQKVKDTGIVTMAKNTVSTRFDAQFQMLLRHVRD